MTKWLLALLIPFFSLGLFADDFGDDGEEEINQNPLTAEISSIQPGQLAPGAQAEIIIDLQIVDTYRAYLDKFKLQWDGDEDVKVGKLDITPVSEFKDTFSGKMKKGVEGTATLRALLELPTDMAAGEKVANFKLGYQACTDKHCLFPKKIALSHKLVVLKEGESPAVAKAEEKSTGGGFFASLGAAASGELSFKQALGQGLFFTFLFIFLAGILTSFTPCIYPMIPITLAVIGAKAKDQSRFKSFMLSIFYVLGIALTFSALGVVAALTGSLFGSALSNPFVVGALAVIFVVLGLSMYGLFEIQAPAALRDKAGSQRGTGYLGALFAGLVSGIVAGPCVGPVLIGVLTHVGEKQDAIYGFSLLFTYSIGMGLIFIALGVSSNLLNKLPKAGGWMDGIKFVFGTMMIAMALYYIEPLASEKFFNTLLAIALILISSSYGAFAANESLNGLGRIRKGIMLTTFVIGVLFMVQAVLGNQFIAAGGGPVSEAAAKDKLKWQPYSDEALAAAQTEGKPAIVDFYADWCVACKELDMFTFTDENVKELSKEFALLKFDATENSEELTRLKKKYGVLGLPTILFINAEGEVLKDITLTGFEEGPQFLERMKKTL